MTGPRGAARRALNVLVICSIAGLAACSVPQTGDSTPTPTSPSGLGGTPSPDVTVSAEDFAVIEGFNEALNRGDLDAAMEFLAEEVRFGARPALSEPDAIRRELESYRVYADCSVVIESAEQSGDAILVTYRFEEREGTDCLDVGASRTVILIVANGEIVRLP